MPIATFTSDFDYTTPKKAIIAYKAGYTGNITRHALAKAKAAGAILPETSIRGEQI